ncbi:molybdopterin-binding protein [Planifilum fimeticola]
MKSRLKEVPVGEAVGLVLAHDLTVIDPGKYKGPLFRKGHRIRREDIEELLRIGKEHVYVLELAEGELHEDEAAERIARAAAGPHLGRTEPKEGKVNLVAQVQGLLRIDVEAVTDINRVEQVALSTLRTHTPVEKGQTVAATRVIPLVFPETSIREVEDIAARRNRPVVEVIPFRPHRVGIVTTGSEVYHGRIRDRFGPVVREKVEKYGSTVVGQTFAADDKEMIRDQIRAFVDQGVDMVLVTSGMSVDPDDRTPGAIASLGAEIITYGTPILPGTMLMIAYYRGIPVLGLPGCVLHDPVTSFDHFLPRILAGEKITREDVVTQGHGGLLHPC